MLILKLVYVGEAVHLNTVATEGRQVSDSPNVGAGKKNSDPLEEQYVRITAALLLSPQVHTLVLCKKGHIMVMRRGAVQMTLGLHSREYITLRFN